MGRRAEESGSVQDPGITARERNLLPANRKIDYGHGSENR
jgi:hypothetical protein